MFLFEQHRRFVEKINGELATAGHGAAAGDILLFVPYHLSAVNGVLCNESFNQLRSAPIGFSVHKYAHFCEFFMRVDALLVIGFRNMFPSVFNEQFKFCALFLCVRVCIVRR
jgi:hypothetical protein